ncbi:MAG TPA: hypothetical protein VLA09_10900, partial [Longimicrobiales bacterium]|nr:hypothetical protein [Longimicrobiales bacterium]
MTDDAFADAMAIAVSFTGLLERLDIRYLVGGSVASSVHGEPRSTNDIDIVADLRPERLDAFVEALSTEYYVSRTAAREAVRLGASFNVIHVGAAVKVDVFVAGRDPFNEERLKRRQLIEISDDPPASIYVDTAEHSVLRKLEWFRRGGEVSDRQWRDVVAILRLQGESLDRTHLATWAD